MAIAAAAICTAVALFILGGIAESWFISLVRPSEGALTWVSDVVLAGSLGVVVYLWLHLRVSRAAVLELERNEIVLDTQLTVAASIQRELLPPVPETRHGVSWGVQLSTAGPIGGDYYDFIDVDETSRVAIVADISGKGIPAALMLVHVRALFRQAVRETHEPREIVARLSEAVRIDTGGVPFLTCIVVRLDEKSGCLTSTNAGHPPAIVIGATSRRMTVGGPPAGLLVRVSYEQEAVRLRSGDRVIFVTDGISERVDLDAAVANLDCHATAQTLCRSVFQLSEGRNAAPPTDGWDDDRTVAVLAID